MNEEEIMAQVTDLFQKAYQAIYGAGKFEPMAEMAKQQGLAPAVSQLLTSITNSVIKDVGVEDVNVLYAFAVILAADLFESLKKVGMEAQEGDMEEVISTTISNVLRDNPEFAATIMADPATAQMLQTAQSGEGRVGQEIAAEGVMDAVAEEVV